MKSEIIKVSVNVVSRRQKALADNTYLDLDYFGYHKKFIQQLNYTYKLTMFVERGIILNDILVLKLHYAMIQFLIKLIVYICLDL